MNIILYAQSYYIFDLWKNLRLLYEIMYYVYKTCIVTLIDKWLKGGN